MCSPTSSQAQPLTDDAPRGTPASLQPDFRIKPNISVTPTGQVGLHTKPALARKLIADAVNGGILAARVAVDEVLGNDP